MKAIVFLGPTMTVGEASRYLDADYRPPAAQGDVYRAALEGPLAIGIVDGYFQHVPAVWHKEILWAMARRVHVFGAASMGALRAAELAAFGMVGVGRIYEAFHDGSLQEDDAVAVAHTDDSGSFRAVSEALVNIYATLSAAVRGGVIATATEETLRTLARADFYPNRSFARLFQRALKDGGVPARELEALRAFLPGGRVDQKRDDTRQLLAALASCLSKGERPPAPRFAFARTEAWHQLVELAAAPIREARLTAPTSEA